MCNRTGINFIQTAVTKGDVRGKRVLEVGSLDVNGSIADHLKSFEPAQYIGVDIESGPGVDVVCNAEHLIERFGAEQFDVVVTTEMLEHVQDWRTIVTNLKGVLKPGGLIVITTRSKGFPIHAYPYDFWRYEIDDMRMIFADFEDLQVASDVPSMPGVFVCGRKVATAAEIEVDLSAIDLYSMLRRRRARDVSQAEVAAVKVAWLVWRRIKQVVPLAPKQWLLNRLSRPAV